MNMDRGKGSKGTIEKKQLPAHLRAKFGKHGKTGEEKTPTRPSKEKGEEGGDDGKDKDKDRRDRKSVEREEEEGECRDDDDEEQLVTKDKPSREDEEEKAVPVRKAKEDGAKAQVRKESLAARRTRRSREKNSTIETVTEGSRRTRTTDRLRRKKKKTSNRRRGSTRSRKVRKSSSKPSNSSGSASKTDKEKGNEKEEKKTKGQKKRNSNETTKKEQDRKKFFKKIIDLTKFWRKQSDCVVQPTPEMLIRPCVAPEYDISNHKDFSPDPHFLFPNEEDWKLRLKNNHAAPEEVFVNRRPFWTRTADDVVPKMGQLRITAEQYGTPPSTSPFMKPSRHRQHGDPRNDTLEKLMGMEPETTEQLLARVKVNTIQATIAIHSLKNDPFPAVRKKDVTIMNLPPVRFSRDKPDQLNLYIRKDRPKAGHSRRFYVVDYSARTKKTRKKRSKEGSREGSKEKTSK